MLGKIFYALACVLVPIVWGWLVHVMFVRWGRRRPPQHEGP